MIEAGGQLARFCLGLGGMELLGYAVLAALVPRPRAFSGLERAALSLGLGALVLTLWMPALTALGLPLSLPLILCPPLGLAAAALAVKLILGRGSSPPTSLTENRKQKTENRFLVWDWLFLSLLALLGLYAGLMAVVYPLWSWDAVATWGYKAKVFYLSRAVDLTCLAAHDAYPYQPLAHNYYPNLIPLLMTYLYFCLGRVNDHLVQGVFPLWGAMLLALLYSWLLRMGLNRRRALGTTAFFALNGTVFITHLYIAYADLALAYFILGAVGLLYLWLAGAAPRGSLALVGCFCAGMAWCKHEGALMGGTIILAALLTLVWLRPPDRWRRLGGLAWPVAGLALGYLPWKLFTSLQHIETGADHILNLYPQQFLRAIPLCLGGLLNPEYFGILWPAAALAVIVAGKTLWTTPRLFLALFLGGNLLAILVAYSLTPTSAAEFPFYIRATLDRLLLHITPVAALLLPADTSPAGDGTSPAARRRPG